MKWLWLLPCLMLANLGVHAQTISIDDTNGLPTGPAGGSLAGTYPNPSIAASVTLTTPVIGAATGTSLSVSGQLTSTVATGTAPLAVSSTTNVANLNASSLSGATFASPGQIGGTVSSEVDTTGIISKGTKFTTSGCAVSSTAGGATAGTFTIGANSCTVIVTMNGATGLTAPTGWACAVEDTSALTVLISQSASSSTTASFPVPVTAGATDVFKFFCMGY